MTAPTDAATPPTRRGPGTPTVPAPTSTPATAAAGTTPDPGTWTRTTRSMIVCLPDHLPLEALTAGRLDHAGVSDPLQTRFWASPALWPWQRRHLIGLRQGRPAWCAGGPVRLLDLPGLRHAAGVNAGLRHRLWQQVVHGTPTARPWTAYLDRHRADPARYPLPRAAADFSHQPRVNAMRLHNTASPGAAQLPVTELEMFQAGPIAYQHYRAATAICGDALRTADGRTLAPASDALCHRVSYLDQAGRYLHAAPPGLRLLAVTV
jgi:hypothetical protein